MADSSPVDTPGRWRNRIVGLEWEPDPTQLLANPLNARRHSGEQRSAQVAALDFVGWVDLPKVNITTQRMLDGHMRVEEAITAGEGCPVLYLELTEEEERFVLLTLDPIAALASYDAPVLDDLTDGITVPDALASIVASLNAEARPTPPLDRPDPPEDPTPLFSPDPAARPTDVCCPNCGHQWVLATDVPSEP